MEGQSGLSELSVISWVSAVEGCPLSGVPLYMYIITDSQHVDFRVPGPTLLVTDNTYNY